MAEIRVRPRAEADLDDAKTWLAVRSIQAAARFEQHAALAVGQITIFPEMYAPIQGGVRFCPIRKSEYHLVYRYDSATDVIDVVAVIHAKQQPRSWP